MEYDYYSVPSVLTDSGSEEPLIPLEYRYILADIVLYYLKIDKDEIDVANLAGQNALKGIAEMSAENKRRLGTYGKVGKIETRQRDIRSKRKRTETDGLIIG